MAGVKAGEAYISLGLKPNMQKGLRAAGQQMKQAGQRAAMGGAAIAAAGGVVLAPLLAATRSFAAMGDEIHKMSARTGVSVTALSELAFAAEQSGGSVQDIEKGFFGLSRAMFDAGLGSKVPIEALGELGLSFEDLKNLSPEEQFNKIADGLAGIEDVSVRGAVAQKLFGRAGRQLLPMLAEGSAGIAAMRKEAADLGRSMSNDDANAAAEYTDAMNRVASVFKGIKQQVGAALAPALAEVATTFAHMAKHVVSFLKENRSTIKIVAGVAAAVIGLGGAIAALGFSFIGIGAALTAMAGLLGFVLSPLGLIVTAIAAVGFAAEHYFGFVSKAINFVIERFSPLVDMWGNALTAIVEAMSTGDLEGAWSIVMEGLEGTFLDLTASIGAYWDTAMHVLVDASAAAAKAIGGIISQLGSWLKTMLQGYKDYYNSVYNNVTEMIGELSGVRTIGGPVDAFGDAGDFVLDAGEAMQGFGSAMQDSAESWRQENQRDVAAREAERKARLDEIRANMGEKAAEAEQAKQKRAEELETLKNHNEKMLDQADAAGGSKGSFSIAAAEALAGGRNTIAHQQLKMAQRNERNTAQIADNTKQNVAVLA
jgi:hypothetical protein